MHVCISSTLIKNLHSIVFRINFNHKPICEKIKILPTDSFLGLTNIAFNKILDILYMFF